MRRGYFLFLPLVLLSLYAASYAQNWSGVLSPDRAVDWSQTGVLWSIPNRTTVCASLNPGATEAQITSAITSCPAGQVVFLNAGTYTVASLNFGYKSNVTLRGAGADKTKIVINGNTGCHYFAGASACLSSSDLNYSAGTSNSANWTAGYSKGTTVITLSSTANLAPGKMLILDQLDDKSDTGQMFVCETAGVCSYKGESGSQRAGRGQQEVHKIVSVSGNQVTIAPGLQNPNWSSGKSPQAWWPNSPMMNSGIEDMTIDQSANGGGQTAGIMFMNSVNCWLKGVRSINAGRNHVMLWATFGTIIRDSYFYGAQSTASTSYGIEWYTASNTLLENNIFQHVTAPITINGAGTGDVIAYNFAIDDNYTAGGAAPGWMQPMIVHHSTGDAMQLFEGNDGLGAQADNVHGTHNFSTYYRNYFYGDIFNNPPKTGNTELLHFWAYSRYFNAIGNVLGRVGYYNTYEMNLKSSGTAIFVLGDPDTQPNTDPLVKTTLMRWGNYDTVNGATRWLSSEVPSGISLFANPVPANQSLPASFYLSGKPAWWGSMAWPAIGPDVAGGNIANVGGHANKIPARACYEGMSNDPGYPAGTVRLFKPGVCYGSGGGTAPNAPAPPTNLNVVVN